MSNLNEESIKTLSRLCRIALSPDETPPLLKDLQRILDYISQLQEVDVSHLNSHIHLKDQGVGELRPDVVEELLSREAFLANAPDRVGGMVRVPPVFKQSS